ncbi:hypothetical protein [Gemmobacter serpentinus]|uniref:hypothetical protein n=1 Tax=Gemmobacter serpentinus TaxID=2652247 RepID=UPI0018657CB8|nr:hypothetical protein [Gemmobacter serpentinus]
MRPFIMTIPISGLFGLSTFPAQAYGGGCRKSSLPGECCHMERATGRVHCH